MATELRDRIEIFQANAELSKFLLHLFPVFEEVLKGQLYVNYFPCYVCATPFTLAVKLYFNPFRYAPDRRMPEYESLNSKCRNVLLETLHRLPNSDALKDYVIRLLRLSMEVCGMFADD